MLFKKNLTTAAICAALSVAAFSAMATDSTDTELTIIGEYTPGACTPVVTGGGIVDYGKHHNSALNPTGKSNKLVQLGRKNSTLNITCTAPTLIAVTSKDNRQSTIVALNDTSYIEKAYDTLVDMKGTKNAFGLGSAPNGQKIGAASIGIDRSKEGANKQVISSQADSLIKISRIWADFFPANNRISLFRLFFPPFLALFPVFTEISPTDVSFGPPETGWPG